MKKSFVMVLVLVLAAASAAHSQTPAPSQPPSREEVMSLLEMMGLREQMHNLLGLMAQNINTQMEQGIAKQFPELNEAQRKIFAEFIGSVTDEAMRLMSVDEMLELSVPVYVKYFTREDIQALSAFYAAPLGQKLIKTMPAMTAETMLAVQTALQPRLEKMDQGMAERVAATVKRIQAAATPQ